MVSFFIWLNFAMFSFDSAVSVLHYVWLGGVSVTLRQCTKVDCTLSDQLDSAVYRTTLKDAPDSTLLWLSNNNENLSNILNIHDFKFPKDGSETGKLIQIRIQYSEKV